GEGLARGLGAGVRAAGRTGVGQATQAYAQGFGRGVASYRPGSVILGSGMGNLQQAGGFIRAGHRAGRARMANGQYAYQGGSASGLYPPSLRADTKRAIQAGYERNAAGQFLDSAGKVLDPYHFGHLPGRESRRVLAAADQLGFNQAQLNDFVNAHPQYFQLQDVYDNLSHRSEMPGTNNLKPILDDIRSFLGL
ncbi:MAG: GH-E family nuclease, partial [Planctomycetota bacterium]